ncbi:HAD family hydrolase [Corynebacterium sp. sy017]|uniref:HAD family hydrolase n=1 Tax=unclassified Corynebacterium TaxID=2624378 RepID=UPI001186C3E8|nr:MULTISPECIES: HAD-IA family hydrolase [unclassified Corynebacterium]MBP3088740.1 HAD family hydrolase [Corynebacterium sp. sy017]QDZ42134.1 HAD-IA family hydrolase [Corynebacterium sp. sy039]TSD92022.1 HAD family hydrolase [Corynebacterium sp. SY003]
MRGLIVDYVGVLDGSDEDQRRWRHLLEAARANGVALAVLSNDPGVNADHIRVLQTQGLVDAVVLSGDIGVEKPEKEAFQAAADALELPMRDCVMVDDSILNVRGAVEAGLVGVYYQQFDRAVVEITGLFGIDKEF